MSFHDPHFFDPLIPAFAGMSGRKGMNGIEGKRP